jgi:hypothetical protein
LAFVRSLTALPAFGVRLVERACEACRSRHLSR